MTPDLHRIPPSDTRTPKENHFQSAMPPRKRRATTRGKNSREKGVTKPPREPKPLPPPKPPLDPDYIQRLDEKLHKLRDEQEEIIRLAEMADNGEHPMYKAINEDMRAKLRAAKRKRDMMFGVLRGDWETELKKIWDDCVGQKARLRDEFVGVCAGRCRQMRYISEIHRNRVVRFGDVAGEKVEESKFLPVKKRARIEMDGDDRGWVGGAADEDKIRPVQKRAKVEIELQNGGCVLGEETGDEKGVRIRDSLEKQGMLKVRVPYCRFQEDLKVILGRLEELEKGKKKRREEIRLETVARQTYAEAHGWKCLKADVVIKRGVLYQGKDVFKKGDLVCVCGHRSQENHVPWFTGMITHIGRGEVKVFDSETMTQILLLEYLKKGKYFLRHAEGIDALQLGESAHARAVEVEEGHDL